jgi:DNA-binding transcriptional ArsR family regulator/uncharacterized protein YndB with AHSA1/START domain
VDDVFKALADPSRRQLLDNLNARDGQSLRELCAGLDMTRQSVSKHLAILEDAGLVTAVWRGREKLHYLNAAPIAEIAHRWINRYRRDRVDALSDLKQALEGTMSETDKPEFLYTTYIRTTPRELWKALTLPEFTRRYWSGITFESEWTVGAPIVVRYEDGRVYDDPSQVVLEADPYRRLSYAWWAVSMCSDPHAADIEPRSKVTFELEEVDDAVKLTVVHDGFEPGSIVFESIRGGWPKVLSELKTLLEVEEPM